MEDRSAAGWAFLRSWRGRWTAGGTLPLVAYGAYLRSAGLNPPSLWIDDAWVALFAKVSIADTLTYGASSPPLFNLLVGLCVSLFPDPELSAQLFPFACSLLGIVAVAWAALQLTRNPACAVFAAAVVACDPFAVIYATRVKQYSSDVLVSALELGLFCLLLRRYTRTRLWVAAAFTAVGLLLSGTSFFVGAAFIPVALGVLWRRGNRDPHLAAAGAMVFLVALGVYTQFMHGRVNTELAGWWTGHFLTTDSPSAFLAAVGRVLARWPAQALHDLPPIPPAPGLEPMVSGPIGHAGLLGTGLCVAGCIALWLRRQRVQLAGLALVVVLVIGASAMGRFPLAGGRVELFLVPLVACLMASGLTLTGTLKHARWRKLGPVLGLAFAAFQLPMPRAQTYPQVESAPLVAHLEQALQPGDALWVNLHGTFVLAYYGDWPLRLTPERTLGQGFRPELMLPGFAIVDREFLSRIQDEAPSERRIFLFGNHHSKALVAGVYTILRSHGYELGEALERPGCVLVRFDRD